MKQKFKDIRFKESSLLIIRRANQIITEYANEGYHCLTLRQLYYQFVSRDWIRNKLTEYKRLGSVINDARLAGMIDWDAIEDRTRNLQAVGHWEEPSDIIKSAAESFRLDKWKDQEYRIEVWVEKDALLGVIERACRALDVSWFSCRGYTSQSEVYSAHQRMWQHIVNRQKPVIIHLGDHDPSGLDMTRDIDDRLMNFLGHAIPIERIALNMDQVEQYNPPENPAKASDSRFEKYEAEFGESSWELDALDLRVIHKLIEDKVAEYRDDEKFDAQKEREEEKRAFLSDASDKWPDIEQMLRDIRNE